MPGLNKQNTNTIHGVHAWYKEVVEDLGWVVIAKSRGYNAKLNAYKDSLEQLLDAINGLALEYVDPDRKHDLSILSTNVEALKEFLNTHVVDMD